MAGNEMQKMAYSTSTIAAGCFGKIYKEKFNGTWAAVKKVPHHLINRRDLDRECEIYSKSVHPNIVKLLKKPTLENLKWIITMEFIFGEELEITIFKSQKSKIQLNPSIKATIITGMCEGLYHLHSKSIVHQDLKPDNIMVEHDTYRAVIIDMGLAKFNRNGLSSAVDMGNEAYSPPEVLSRVGHRDQRSDVWAMGKIIAELCARVRLHTPSVCPDKIKETLSHQGQLYCNVVCRMVQTDPKQRATMAEVMPEIRGTGGIENPKLQQSANIQTPSPNTEVTDNLPHVQAPVQGLRRSDIKTLRRAPIRPPSSSIWERAALPPNPEVKISPIPEEPVPFLPPSPGPVPRGAAKDIVPPPQAPVQGLRRSDIKTLCRAPVRPPSSSIWERAAHPPNPVVKITPIPKEPVQYSQPSPRPVPRGAAKDIFPQPQAPAQNGRSPQAPVRAPSPSRWEGIDLPKAEVKTEVQITLLPQAPVRRSPSPSRWERAAAPKPEVKKSPTPDPKVDHGKTVGPVAQSSQDAKKKWWRLKEV